MLRRALRSALWHPGAGTIHIFTGSEPPRRRTGAAQVTFRLTQVQDKSPAAIITSAASARSSGESITSGVSAPATSALAALEMLE